jgi:threonine dehydratase
MRAMAFLLYEFRRTKPKILMLAIRRRLGNNGRTVTKKEFARGVEAAAGRIRADIVRTPLEPSPALSRALGADVLIKWECDQTTGSFKLRGAFHALRSLTAEQRRAGGVSATTGNHGLAMTHAARVDDVSLEHFVPRTIAAVKIKKLKAGGAVLTVRGATCEQSEIHARGVAAASGRAYVSPYNDLHVIFGQGTVGLEIWEDAPGVDAVLVPVGGGGLAAGIAGFLKSRRRPPQVWGVEPVHSAFMRAAFAAGRLVDFREKPTIADAVAGGLEPGSITFPLCRKTLDGILAVREAELKRALRMIEKAHGRVVEGAGALALAGLLAEPRRFRGRTVVLVVSGGNAAASR